MQSSDEAVAVEPPPPPPPDMSLPPPAEPFHGRPNEDLESTIVEVIRVTNTVSPVEPPAESVGEGMTPVEEVSFTPTEEATPAPGATGTALADAAAACKPWEPFEFKPGHFQRVGFTLDPPCIHWVDDYDDETGFRIEFTYNGVERFVWEVPAGTQHILVPEEAGSPYSYASGCARPVGHELRIFAIRPGGETEVGGSAADGGGGSCPEPAEPGDAPESTG